MRLLGEILASAICIAATVLCAVLVAAHIWFGAAPESLLVAIVALAVAAGAAKVADNLSE